MTIRLPTPASEAPAIRKYGVVAVVLSDDRFLVIRRSQLVHAPGMYCFPGGGIERGESEEDALRREFREELSVAALPKRRLWESVTPWQVHLAWWLAGIDASAELIPNPQEVESIHWLAAAEIRTLPQLLASNVEFLDAWERGL